MIRIFHKTNYNNYFQLNNYNFIYLFLKGAKIKNIYKIKVTVGDFM